MHIGYAWLIQLTASATSFIFGLVTIPYVWAPTLTRNAPRVMYCVLEISLPMTIRVQVSEGGSGSVECPESYIRPDGGRGSNDIIDFVTAAAV